ncbi:MAG: hypothetical protein AB8B99_24170 [Phormidesmis sp.]
MVHSAKRKFLSLKTLKRLALLTGLVGPFLLTEYAGHLEPYPAVIQPGGAHKVSVDDETLTFNETQLIAVAADGSQQLVDTEAFMGDIPHHFWSRLAGKNFGLGKANETRDLSVGVWTLSAEPVQPATSAEKKEALNWIQKRLKAQGMTEIDTLRVQRSKLFFDVKAGEKAKREITEQVDVDISERSSR